MKAIKLPVTEYFVKKNNVSTYLVLKNVEELDAILVDCGSFLPCSLTG